MKEFACGSVVQGCTATFSAASEDQILAEVAEHARVDHGITEVSPELLGQVRAHIHDA
jgi:predicted small metal-binding protein